MKNGTLRARDFPVYFSSRCLNTENFVNAVNREIFALRYRSQLDESLREKHELFKKQYDDRINSRLIGSFRSFRFLGEDIRIKKTIMQNKK